MPAFGSAAASAARSGAPLGGVDVEGLHPAPSTLLDSYNDLAAESQAASDGNERSKLNALPSRLA